MENTNISSALYSLEDYLQLYQMEKLSERFTNELLAGCIYVITDSQTESVTKSASAYLIATKERKTTITKQELAIVNNSITLLHLDDWLFDSAKNNTRHIRLIAINGVIHFQALDDDKSEVVINVTGSGLYSVLWGTFIACLGVFARDVLLDYEKHAQVWRKNQS